jgi:hypothetical protein
MFYPQPFAWGDTVIAKIEPLPLLVPFGGLLIFGVGLCWKILFPTKNALALAKWQHYPQLRLTTIVGEAFIAAGAVSAVIGAFGWSALPAGVSTLLIVSGYLIAAIAVLTLLMAALTVRALVTGGN